MRVDELAPAPGSTKSKKRVGRGIGQSNLLPDRPEIRGMIARVPHLIRVETLQSVDSQEQP